MNSMCETICFEKEQVSERELSVLFLATGPLNF